MADVRVLLITDPRRHHSPAGADAIAEILRAANIIVTSTEDASAARSLADGAHDCVMLYTQGDTFNPAEVDSLTAWVRQGGALVGVHSAAATNKTDDRYARLIGSRFIGHGPVGDFTVRIADANHPIARGISDFTITDELYRLRPFDSFQTILTADLDGEPQPMAYSKSEGAGRVVYLANGHDLRSINHPAMQHLLVQAVNFAVNGMSRTSPPVETGGSQIGPSA